MYLSNSKVLLFLLTLEWLPSRNKLNIGAEASTIEKFIVDSAPKAEMFDFFHVMPNGNVEVMTEFDLLLTMDQYESLYNTPGRAKRKAVSDVNKRWKNCYVYYEITDSLDTKTDRDIINEAIKEWQKYTCLQFIEDPSKPQRIQFKDGGGCYSKLGMQDEPQPLVLARGCRTKGTIAHEIGHAIGWIHEHMRPDRDDYIYVNLDAIDTVHHSQYRKYDANAISIYDIPYDYNSLMHYGNSVFPNSLLTLDPNYQEKIGQRDGFSFKDIKLANVMYGCAKMSCTVRDCGEGFQLSKKHKGHGKCLCWCDSGDVRDPLVLCSKRKTTPPPPQPSPMPTEMPGKTCVDVRTDCKLAKQLGHCMTKMDLMAKMCSKTCNFCDKGKQVCMDYDKGCPIMAAAGACKKPGFEKTMTELCKGSCGLCPKPPNPCDIQKEMMGDDNQADQIGNSGISSKVAYYSFTFTVTLSFFYYFSTSLIL